MKTRYSLLLFALALTGIGATTYTITQLTENATPGAGTIIEIYDPTATPKSGKITLNSAGFRTAAGVTAAFIQANQTNVTLASLGGAPLANPTFTGSLTATGEVQFIHTHTNDATRPVAFDATYIASPSLPITKSTDYHGIDLLMYSKSPNITKHARLYPFESSAIWAGSGQIKAMVGGYFRLVQSSTGEVTTATNIRLATSNGGTIDELRHLYVENPTNTGTIDELYGIKIDPLDKGTNNYGIWSATTNNWFAGIKVTATNNPAVVITQASDPGSDAMQINQNHTTARYPLRVTTLGRTGPLFVTYSNGDGGNGLTVDQKGTGNGTLLRLINSGTGDAIVSDGFRVIKSGGVITSGVAVNTVIGGAATLEATNTFYLVNEDSQTITLPSAIGITGRNYEIKTITPAETCTIATTSSQLIDGASSYSLTASNKFVSVRSDGTNWWVIGNN